MSTQNPPMDPTSSEADAKQLELARRQGEAYREALDHMAKDVAHDGGMQTAGEYLVAYAIEEAEGMYMWEDGELVWHDPEEENLHVEVVVDGDTLGIVSAIDADDPWMPTIRRMQDGEIAESVTDLRHLDVTRRPPDVADLAA